MRLAFIRGWYEKKIISPDFFTKGYQENRTEIEGNRVGMNYTHPWGGVVGGGIGSMANDPNARWIWIDVPAGPVRKGKNYFSPLRTGVFPFRKGSEHIDKILKQANFESEIVLSPQRRYHGFEGHNYEWVEGEDQGCASVGRHAWVRHNQYPRRLQHQPDLEYERNPVEAQL